MPRPLWNGSISFGLVTIPVKLFNAVSRKNVSFNQIDTRSGSRIKMKKVSAVDGSDVPDDAIVKGYELTSGNYVLLTQDELDAFEARRRRRSRSTSSSTSTRSTRSSTTARTTSPPTRRP